MRIIIQRGAEGERVSYVVTLLCTRTFAGKLQGGRGRVLAARQPDPSKCPSSASDMNDWLNHSQ